MIVQLMEIADELEHFGANCLRQSESTFSADAANDACALCIEFRVRRRWSLSKFVLETVRCLSINVDTVLKALPSVAIRRANS
jgi:hypothetical protein